MSALRLMTFNVQFPSLAMAVGQGQDNEAEAGTAHSAGFWAIPCVFAVGRRSPGALGTVDG
jgi:hypothetical protein